MFWIVKVHVDYWVFVHKILPLPSGGWLCVIVADSTDFTYEIVSSLYSPSIYYFRVDLSLFLVEFSL